MHYFLVSNSIVEFVPYIKMLCQIIIPSTIIWWKKNLFRALLFWSKLSLFSAFSFSVKPYFILCIIILYQILIYFVHRYFASNSNKFCAFYLFIFIYNVFLASLSVNQFIIVLPIVFIIRQDYLPI